MQRTFKEKVTARLARMVKKHKWTLPFGYLCMALFLLLYNVCCYFEKNCKRYTSVLVCGAMFLCTSSFLSPATEQEFNTVSYEEAPEAMESDISFAQEEQEEPGQNVELLEDQDVLDGYDDSELDSIVPIITYSLEDILAEGDNLSITEDKLQQETELINFDKSDWRLLLVNKQHPIPEDYKFTLGKITGSMQCDERVIPELLAMLQAAKEDGISLVVCSPYRDLARQEMLFNRKIDIYMGKGMSYMEAYKVASQAVTVPGASEHQLGLAFDIVCNSYSSLTAGFGETDAGKWLAEHSCEYGFILRYPLGKEYITSIEYEPWHFRYVGKEAATIIMSEGITLEEFVERL